MADTIMDKSVLLISENKNSFITTSLKTALENADIRTYSTEPSVLDIDALQKMTSIIIISSGEFLKDKNELLFYLKDVCIKNDKKLVLIGNDINDMAFLKQSFPLEAVVGEYLRPIDVVELANEVKSKFEKLSSKELKKILVVDDSGIMLRTIMSWLEGKYKVFLANSATSALVQISQNVPDLILLDYEMPVCSGAQFLEMIRAEESTKHIPVFFLTSRGDAETVKSVLGLRPEGYLVKTTPSDQVVAAIDKFFLNQN